MLPLPSAKAKQHCKSIDADALLVHLAVAAIQYQCNLSTSIAWENEYRKLNSSSTVTQLSYCQYWANSFMLSCLSNLAIFFNAYSNTNTLMNDPYKYEEWGRQTIFH